MWEILAAAASGNRNETILLGTNVLPVNGC
jgi:hypothetical protein